MVKVRLVNLTAWPSLYELDAHETIKCSWPELVADLSTHLEVQDKNAAPGFGPYVLRTLEHPCYAHDDGIPRTAPHRCNACVAAITALVYDADQGPWQDVAKTEGLLRAAGVAFLWYSSHSWTPAHPHYPGRFVIPISEPLPPTIYGPVWDDVRRRFQIPADPKKCRGLSHFFFLPSCQPGGERKVVTAEGAPLDVSFFVMAAPPPRPQVPWSPLAAPEAPSDLAPLRAKLIAKLTSLKRKGGDLEKALYLDRVLNGQAIFPHHGHRNQATLIAAGAIAWALPDQAVETLYELMRPAVEAMISDGSSITQHKVETMLQRSLYNHAQEQGMRQVVKNWSSKWD